MHHAHLGSSLAQYDDPSLPVYPEASPRWRRAVMTARPHAAYLLAAVCQTSPKNYRITRGAGGYATQRYTSRSLTPRHSGNYYFWDSSHHLAHPELTGNPYSQVCCLQLALLAVYIACIRPSSHLLLPTRSTGFHACSACTSRSRSSNRPAVASAETARRENTTCGRFGSINLRRLCTRAHLDNVILIEPRASSVSSDQDLAAADACCLSCVDEMSARNASSGMATNRSCTEHASNTISNFAKHTRSASSTQLFHSVESLSISCLKSPAVPLAHRCRPASGRRHLANSGPPPGTCSRV